MKSLLVLACVISTIYANQNLCGDRVRVPQFVNDYSSCRGYLFCNFNPTGQLVSVHQLMCPLGTVFNPFLSVCDGTGATVCDPNNLCPPGQSIMVADPTDPRCQRFNLCANGNLLQPIGTCPMDTVFNRNYGTCTSEAEAPCFGYTESPCEPFANGFYRVFGSCSEHAFCVNGEEVSRHNCPASLHFNPMTRTCDQPGNLVPPCPWA